MTNDPGQRRGFFRVRYPSNLSRPVARLGNREFEVLEISEHGARIKPRKGHGVFVGQPFSGSFRFPDGAIILVHGVIARVESNQVVLKLDPGISFKRILFEQQQLLKSPPDPTQPDPTEPQA